MKKLIYLVLIVFTAIACSKDNKEPEKPKPEKKPVEAFKVTFGDAKLEGDFYRYKEIQNAYIKIPYEVTSGSKKYDSQVFRFENTYNPITATLEAGEIKKGKGELVLKIEGNTSPLPEGFPDNVDNIYREVYFLFDGLLGERYGDRVTITFKNNPEYALKEQKMFDLLKDKTWEMEYYLVRGNGTTIKKKLDYSKNFRFTKDTYKLGNTNSLTPLSNRIILNYFGKSETGDYYVFVKCGTNSANQVISVYRLIEWDASKNRLKTTGNLDLKGDMQFTQYAIKNPPKNLSKTDAVFVWKERE